MSSTDTTAPTVYPYWFDRLAVHAARQNGPADLALALQDARRHGDHQGVAVVRRAQELQDGRDARAAADDREQRNRPSGAQLDAATALLDAPHLGVTHVYVALVHPEKHLGWWEAPTAERPGTQVVPVPGLWFAVDGDYHEAEACASEAGERYLGDLDGTVTIVRITHSRHGGRITWITREEARAY